MPPIRDVMPAFELFQPASVNDVLGVLNRHGADAWVMAGGMDTFDWLKDRISSREWSSISAWSTSCAASRTPAAASRSAR